MDIYHDDSNEEIKNNYKSEMGCEFSPERFVSDAWFALKYSQFGIGMDSEENRNVVEWVERLEKGQLLRAGAGLKLKNFISSLPKLH